MIEVILNKLLTRFQKMYYKNISSLMIGFFLCVTVNAQLQDCTLGIGGKDTEILAQVFQLKDGQIDKMELWIGQLQTENRLAEDQIKELFDNHPQSTHEELETLAKKYKVLKDKMVATSKKYDKKLLGIFNEKQYQRYVELCNEALRRPMIATSSATDVSNPE